MELTPLYRLGSRCAVALRRQGSAPRHACAARAAPRIMHKWCLEASAGVACSASRRLLATIAALQGGPPSRGCRPPLQGGDLRKARAAAALGPGIALFPRGL